MLLLKRYILFGQVKGSPKCFFSMVQWLGHLALLSDTLLAGIPCPPPSPHSASCPAGVWAWGWGEAIAQRHTEREGQALATRPPEIQSSCCKRNLMVCPHPAPDEITSDLGKVTTPSCWFVHMCHTRAAQPAAKKVTMGAVRTSSTTAVSATPGKAREPFCSFATPKRTRE